MIELMLVVALVALLAMVTVPSFVQSIRGNRLRAAVRTVVSAGRYARSMALLQQRPAEVVFLLEESRIEIHLRQRMSDAVEDDAGASTPPRGAETTLPQVNLEQLQEMPESSLAAAAFADSLKRRLDGVRIVSVTFDAATDQIGQEGAVRVVTYGSNGRCRPYRVLLEEEHGDRALIKVDILGNATVEWQRR